MSDNIVSLVKKEDEDKPPRSLQEVLDGMLEHGELEEGIIIGLSKEEGGLMVASNLPTLSSINMLLDTAKLNILTSTGEQ